MFWVVINILIFFVTVFAVEEKRETYIGEEEIFLKTLLEAFVGAGKLKEALKIAERGTKAYPESLFWWEYYAKLLLWNGKTRRAIEAYIKAGDVSGKNVFFKKAFDLAVKIGDYIVAEKLLSKISPSYEDLKKVYEMTGNVEGLKRLLKGKNTKESLKELIDLLIFLGDIEEVLKEIDLFIEKYGLSKDMVLKKAHLLYKKREFKKALYTLKEFESLAKAEDYDYWKTLSDLAWALGDAETAFRASYLLMIENRAREVDFIRLTFFLSKLDRDRAVEFALGSYKKLKSVNLLRITVSILYEQGRWKELINLIENTAKKEELLRDEYILTKYILALFYEGKEKKAINMFKSHTEKKLSPSLLSQYIYMLISRDNIKELKEVLRRYGKYENLRELTPAFISAYLALGLPKKAYRIYLKNRLKDELILAEIMESLGKTKTARGIKYRQFLLLEAKLKNNPTLFKDRDFIIRYLYLGIEYIPYDEYISLLNSSKRILPRSIWDDIYISFLLSKNKLNKADHYIKDSKIKPKLWVSVLLFSKGYKYYRKYINEEYLSSIQLADIESFKGNKRLELYYILKSYGSRPYHLGIYNRLLHITKETSDIIDTSISYISRSYYTEVKTDMHIKLPYLKGSYGFDININKSLPIKYEKKFIVKTLPYESIKMGIFKKFSKKFLFNLNIGTIKREELLSQFGFKLNVDLTKYIKLKFSFNKNEIPEETTFLYISSFRDKSELNITYRITEDFEVSGFFKHNMYRLHSGERIGYGEIYTLQFNYSVIRSFPDINIGLFFEKGIFGERLNINKDFLVYKNIPILPYNYEAFGTTINIGSSIRYTYFNKPKPFLSLLLGESTAFGSVLGVNAGMAGKLFGNDKIKVEGSISQNIYSFKESIYFLKLEYSILF